MTRSAAEWAPYNNQTMCYSCLELPRSLKLQALAKRPDRRGFLEATHISPVLVVWASNAAWKLHMGAAHPGLDAMHTWVCRSMGFSFKMRGIACLLYVYHI